MTIFSRALAGALVFLAAAPAVAQDEPQTFNAFAVVVANGTVVRAGDKQLAVEGSLAGPMFIETDEGPQQAGRVGCALSSKIDQASRKTSATGACTFTAYDGATAWGEWDCAGYELVGCRGIDTALGHGLRVGLSCDRDAACLREVVRGHAEAAANRTSCVEAASWLQHDTTRERRPPRPRAVFVARAAARENHRKSVRLHVAGGWQRWQRACACVCECV